jgi:hypothetical protein
MDDNGVGPAHCHTVNRCFHIDQAVYRTDGNTMIHGDNYRAPGLAIQNAFQANHFANHTVLLVYRRTTILRPTPELKNKKAVVASSCATAFIFIFN